MKMHRTFNTLGVFGYGTFGKLIAHHLFPHFDINVYDPATDSNDSPGIDRINVVHLRSAASCDIVVVDVGSVKMSPVSAMTRLLPETVEVIGTHPLFGPQSAKAGIERRKIVVCPVRGQHARRARAFFRKVLGLNVIFASPEKHDREMAVVQGITHLVAKVLVEMEPLPTAMTTASFDAISLRLVRGAPPQTLIPDPKPGVGNCTWTVLRPLAPEHLDIRHRPPANRSEDSDAATASTNRQIEVSTPRGSAYCPIRPYRGAKLNSPAQTCT